MKVARATGINRCLMYYRIGVRSQQDYFWIFSGFFGIFVIWGLVVVSAIMIGERG
jgi:hypothetical protein